MAAAVASGLPKRMIEEAATRRQASVDKGEDVIVGVNKYAFETEDLIETLEIDNSAVRKAQINRIELVERNRDPLRVAATLATLEEVATSSTGNILESAVEAARALATVGEISDALRRVFGDHSATEEVSENVYGHAYGDELEYKTLVSRLANYAALHGSKPHILVAKLGQDGRDRGAKIIASAFGDIGFDVIVGPLFEMPYGIAELAIRSEVRIIGVSSLAAGHKTLVPQLVDRLKAKGAENITVICGGVVPRKDYQFLLDRGVAAIFGPGTNVLEAARTVLGASGGHSA